MTTTHPRGSNVPRHVVSSPFALFLWGGDDKFERRKNALDALSTDSMFSKTAPIVHSQARKDVWNRIAQQSKKLVALKLRHRWSDAQLMDAIAMTDWMMPIHPQFRIFKSNLERQMSDQQKSIWIPMTERFEILGCYCQTELGHGSNVRGIETTATFDEEHDEFVLNSPTLSSTKYWIGAAGIWATHGLVVARLLIRERDHGNHLFLVQLRDLNTHDLQPGVEIYELGPKVFQGMLGTDNGALQFHQVRIPRSQMLARNAQVLQDGTYIQPQNTKHSYGSMVTVRALMAETTGWDLVKAVVVAYHYTKFRRQFKEDNTTNTENVVFDYASVRCRIVPLLAMVSMCFI
jgi:acyl-CoA oxidase